MKKLILTILFCPLLVSGAQTAQIVLSNAVSWGYGSVAPGDLISIDAYAWMAPVGVGPASAALSNAMVNGYGALSPGDLETVIAYGATQGSGNTNNAKSAVYASFATNAAPGGNIVTIQSDAALHSITITNTGTAITFDDSVGVLTLASDGVGKFFLTNYVGQGISIYGPSGLELLGLDGNQIISLTSPSNQFSGTFTGNGSGLTGVKVADTNITGTITVMNGNVGIGTTNPLQKLDIRPDSGWTDTEAIQLAQTGDNPSIRLFRTAGDGINAVPWYILNTGSNYGDLEFMSGNNAAIGSESMSAKMTILVGGNVGIGTTAPATALQVNGTVTASGYASTALDSQAITSVGWTNSTGKNAVVYLTAATALELHQHDGSTVFSGYTIVAPFTVYVQAGGWFIGTGITGSNSQAF
jgi:hypothetical protein